MERYGVTRNDEGYRDPTAGAALKKEGGPPNLPRVKRGDIFYISIPYATGHEMDKDRPGIVVSCNALNDTSPCVVMVMLSASNKRRDLPEHVPIRSTPQESTALCQHIYTVDKSRLGTHLGRCSKSEMAAVDTGIMSGLELDGYGLARADEPPVERAPEPVIREGAPPSQELVRAEAERDLYRDLYERLLDRVTA